MLMQLTSITRVTFIEAVRQPIFVVLLLLGTLLMVLNPFMAAYSMEPGAGDNKMLVDLGLGTVFIVGVFLAAFTATGVIHQEMANKTALDGGEQARGPAGVRAGQVLGRQPGRSRWRRTCSTLVLLFTLRHKVMQNKSDPIWIGRSCCWAGGGVLLALAIAGRRRTTCTTRFLRRRFTLRAVDHADRRVRAGNGDRHSELVVCSSPATDFVADDGRLAPGRGGRGVHRARGC